MPPDHLNTEPARSLRISPPLPDQPVLTRAVESALGGTPVKVAALSAGTTADLLAQAVEVYRTAGQAALTAQAGTGWCHVSIQFADWRSAESAAAAELAPRLHDLTTSGAITGWWFLRKYPCWRVRLHPTPETGNSRVQADAEIGTVLEDLVRAGTLERWWPAIYEPETFALGGQRGMTVAHDHFCADSRSTLDYLSQATPAIGRRELSVLLCNAMFAAAGLDWFEIGDVWDKIARLRPAAHAPSPARHRHLVSQFQELLPARVGPGSPLFDPASPISFAARWVHAFDRAGRDLGASASAGTLQRGVRHILSHIVIFHWNRLGLPAEAQSALSRAARDATLPRS